MVTTSTELHIPVGHARWTCACTRDNVIHSFWVPELNGKKDVMPGRTNHITIEADKPGTYLGACAEYCGLSHADMRMRVIAEPMDEVEGVARRPAAAAPAQTVDAARSERVYTAHASTYGARTATSSTTRRSRTTART